MFFSSKYIKDKPFYKITVYKARLTNQFQLYQLFYVRENNFFVKFAKENVVNSAIFDLAKVSARESLYARSSYNYKISLTVKFIRLYRLSLYS